MDIFSAFEQVNVLVVGDVMIDQYLTGSVSRISPEAPVPVVYLQETDNRLGGAANVALNLKALGANPFLCTVIGEDAYGEIFTGLLPNYNLSSKGIIKSKERATTLKTRIIAQHQHLLRIDKEDTHDLSPKEAQHFIARVKAILDSQHIHVILFQDYNKGVLTQPVIHEIILEALRRDIPTAVDPKHKNFWAFKHVTLFKPNLKEIQEQTSFQVAPEEKSLRQAVDYIKKQLGNKYTLITLSDKGLFIDGNGKQLLAPTQPRDIADVCGAGDTVISIAALGLAASLSIADIALLSNLAGGQVCEHIGVVPVNKEQLKQEYYKFVS